MQTVNLESVFNDIRHAPAFERNAIVEYLLDLFAHDSWDSVTNFISQLESASCEDGSFGEDTIYTNKILAKLGDEGWRDAIQAAIESYEDATGESPSFDRDHMGYSKGLQLESIVTFAVNWWSGEIASYLRHMGERGQFYIAVLDKYEPWEERHAFSTYWEAEEAIEKAIEAAMDYEMQHAQSALTDEEYEAISEDVMSRFAIEEESA